MLSAEQQKQLDNDLLTLHRHSLRLRNNFAAIDTECRRFMRTWQEDLGCGEDHLYQRVDNPAKSPGGQLDIWEARCVVLEGGSLKPRKTFHLPTRWSNHPELSEDEFEAFQIAIRDGVARFPVLRRVVLPRNELELCAQCRGGLVLALEHYLKLRGFDLVQRKADPKKAARNKWIYTQCKKGVLHKEIVSKLKPLCKEQNWDVITTVTGIRKAAQAYATKKTLPPPPPRQNL